MFMGWLAVAGLAATVYDRLRRRREKRAGARQVISRRAERVIYDFGARHGNDVAYHLVKCEKVVVASPDSGLCESLAREFEREIKAARLDIVNVTLARHDSPESATGEHADGPIATPVPRRRPSSLVDEFGPAEYVQIDAPGDELTILEELFVAGVFPPEVALNARAGAFDLLVRHGYQKFSFVAAGVIEQVYATSIVSTRQGVRRFMFRAGCSGPFGDDIRAPWEDAESFASTLRRAGPLWMLHARRQ